MLKPLALALALALATPVHAQSLFRQPPPAAPITKDGTADTNAHMRGMSLTLVEAPKPKTFEIHDKVTIIISETSKQSSQAKLDTKKDSKLKAAVNKFPDLARFLEAELGIGEGDPEAAVDVGASSNYKGDGKFERSDKFTDRITATVIDVKPNGVLILEARRTIGKDKEVQTLVLSGECRRDDVTTNNTVLSHQLSDLTLLSTSEGNVKDAASKGLLTRVVEAIFNF